MTDEEFATRYMPLAHAIQTANQVTFDLDQQGVAIGAISPTQPGTSPKMLRTGIDMAMCEAGAVSRLLMEKGVFTQQEYQTSIIVMLEEEVERREGELSARMGREVKLG